MSRRRLTLEWDSIGPAEDDDVVRIVNHHFRGLVGVESNPLVMTSVGDPVRDLFDGMDAGLKAAAEKANEAGEGTWPA